MLGKDGLEKIEKLRIEWNEDERIENFKERTQCIFSGSLVNYMIESGFFTCPSSTKHHGAFEGGNFWHSRMVAILLREYTEKMKLQWERPESPEIIGWAHDLCKMDEYIKVSDGVGRYHYESNQNASMTGHGMKSAIIALERMKLTDEEVHCITWHMGAFVGKENWKKYSAAVKKYPNILWVHQADMIASYVNGI